ncbi:MAG TPA: condensation domain-containing protein, partial [Terriglobales bacterium]
MAGSSNLSAAKRSLLEKYLRGNSPHAGESLARIVPRKPGHTAPLSFSQQQVWLHSQIAPKDVPLYNETLTLHRNGPLELDILGHAMDEIIRRHEIWRTTFDIVEGEPVQIVHPPKPGFEFQAADLRALPSEKRAAEAMHLACYEARKAFDLKTGPLLRGLLVRLGDGEHRLFLTFHQLIFDGVTAYHVFLPELVSIYEAFSEGQPSPLTEPALQYADYAVWQRNQLKEDRIGTQQKYWQETLKGDLPLLEWPLDRARPPVQNYRGDIQTFALSEAELQPLKALSQQHNVSLFMILVAGLAAVLHRYTGQEDIILGAPTAGRNARELQGMLGYFLNVLPLRIDVSRDPPFSELLRRVKEAVIGALSNQDVPFTQLVETIRPSPDPSRNPFFQVAISLEPPVKIAARGWAATQSDVPTGASKLDLYIDVDERSDGIQGPVSYNPDVFDASTISNMLEHWRTLLVGAATDPNRPVSDLPILTARDRQQLVVDWNKTTAEYPRDECIHELFADQCQRPPQATALQMGPEVLSFRDLDQRSSRLASYLQKLGIQAGGRVAVLMERSFEVVVAMLATLKVGAAFVPLDASYPADRLAFMLRDCDPVAVITRERFRGKLPRVPATVICSDTEAKQIAAESIETPTATCKPDDPAYVIYTSGSTGKPRGVVATHRACLNRFSWMWREYPFAAGEVCCQKTNLGFVDSIWEIFGPLL